jgi:histidinol-phosphate phosphatase family protein
MRQAIILAGGKGTRLKERLDGLPKPLIKIAGVPLLERQINLLKKYDFTDIIILVNYKADKITEFCKLNDNWGLNISCIDDQIPMGTAGATLKIFDLLENEFLVVYGDTMLNVNIENFFRFHKLNTQSSASLFLHPNDHPFDSDIVEIDINCKIIQFHSYPHPPNYCLPNLVNAALYWIKKEALAKWKDNYKTLDFAKDLFPMMLNEGFYLQGYNSIEYIKDVGTPNRLDKVTNDFLSGKIDKFDSNQKHKVVFVDRDGTVNSLPQIRSSEVYLIDGVSEAIYNLNKSDYLTCLMSDESIVESDESSIPALQVIHNKIESLLGKNGAFLNRIYYCPHQTIKDLEYNKFSYNIICKCVKPDIGLIEHSIDELNIDITKSWFVGDTSTDILTAQKAGLMSILVETGFAGLDYKYWVTPDFVVPNLLSAVNLIQIIYPKLMSLCSEHFKEISKGHIIFIGGLSRAGKSSFASTLRLYLKENNIRSHVISLDRWLKSHSKRSEGVLGRYDVDSFYNFFQQIINATENVSFSLPAYHKKNKEKHENVEIIDYSSDDVIIFEGTIILELQKHMSLNSNMSIYIKLDEVLRKARVINEYLIRGFSNEEANHIYQHRELDETPFITNSENDYFSIDLTEIYNQMN